MSGTPMSTEVVQGLRHKLQQLALDGYLIAYGQLHSLFERADESASHHPYDIEANWTLMSTCKFRIRVVSVMMFLAALMPQRLLTRRSFAGSVTTENTNNNLASAKILALSVSYSLEALATVKKRKA